MLQRQTATYDKSMGPNDPPPLEVLEYASPRIQRRHTRFGIGATAIFTLVIVWCLIDRPFPWPMQQRAELAAWLIGVAMTAGAYFAKGRDRYFAHIAAVLLVTSFLVWSICLPSV